MEQAILDAGIEIEDPVGRAYDPNSSLEVLITHEGGGTSNGSPPQVITETVAPVVRVDGKVVAHGQVVIGVPADLNSGGTK
ncbi:MAG: hypothetical protein ACR2NO_06365 [Chloroflexota bacterium]